MDAGHEGLRRAAERGGVEVGRRDVDCAEAPVAAAAEEPLHFANAEGAFPVEEEGEGGRSVVASGHAAHFGGEGEADSSACACDSRRSAAIAMKPESPTRFAAMHTAKNIAPRPCRSSQS